MSSTKSVGKCVEVVAKKAKVEEAPSTPPRRLNPCPSDMIRRHQVRHWSKVLEARGRARQGYPGTPVRIWPKAFWTARRNLYEECQDLRPATPVKICPPCPPNSPQDIF